MYTAISNKKVLISTLDWGMGHTSRCVVIIKQLLENNCTVHLLVSNIQRIFLEKEINSLRVTYHLIFPYDIKYSSHGLILRLIIQIPKILLKISKEHKWLNAFLKHQSFDLIISDNRYGLYNKKVKSVLLTHQLQLQVPFAYNFINSRLANWINNFDEVWIPDDKELNITQQLSINKKVTKPIYFIGLLNRLQFNLTSNVYDTILVIATGPVIAKNELVNKICNCQQNLNYLVVGYENIFTKNRVKSIGQVSGCALAELISAHKYIVTRSGYTSIMELSTLNEKKIILIPTNGQFEQEYLANETPKRFKQFKDIVISKLNEQTIRSFFEV